MSRGTFEMSPTVPTTPKNGLSHPLLCAYMPSHPSPRAHSPIDDSDAQMQRNLIAEALEKCCHHFTHFFCCCARSSYRLRDAAHIIRSGGDWTLADLYSALVPKKSAVIQIIKRQLTKFESGDRVVLEWLLRAVPDDKVDSKTVASNICKIFCHGGQERSELYKEFKNLAGRLGIYGARVKAYDALANSLVEYDAAPKTVGDLIRILYDGQDDLLPMSLCGSNLYAVSDKIIELLKHERTAIPPTAMAFKIAKVISDYYSFGLPESWMIAPQYELGVFSSIDGAKLKLEQHDTGLDELKAVPFSGVLFVNNVLGEILYYPRSFYAKTKMPKFGFNSNYYKRDLKCSLRDCSFETYDSLKDVWSKMLKALNDFHGTNKVHRNLSVYSFLMSGESVVIEENSVFKDTLDEDSKQKDRKMLIITMLELCMRNPQVGRTFINDVLKSNFTEVNSCYRKRYGSENCFSIDAPKFKEILDAIIETVFPEPGMAYGLRPVSRC